MNEALEQKARIVILNATQTYPGFVLNEYAAKKGIDIPLSTTLNDSFEILESNHSHIAVIFGASAIDNNWKFKFSSFAIPIPVRSGDSGRLVVDESQL